MNEQIIFRCNRTPSKFRRNIFYKTDLFLSGIKSNVHSQSYAVLFFEPLNFRLLSSCGIVFDTKYSDGMHVVRSYIKYRYAAHRTLLFAQKYFIRDSLLLYVLGDLPISFFFATPQPQVYHNARYMYYRYDLVSSTM